MLQARDVNNEGIINFIKFPIQALAPSDPPAITIHVWNGKGLSCNKVASDVRVSLVNASKDVSGETDYGGQEIIDNDLVEVRSDGVEGSGIVDDLQASWTQIGKTNYLSIGDIPINTARKLHFRYKSELTTTTDKGLFFLKIRYNYSRTQAYQYVKTTNSHNFIGSKFYGGGWFF